MWTHIKDTTTLALRRRGRQGFHQYRTLRLSQNNNSRIFDCKLEILNSNQNNLRSFVNLINRLALPFEHNKTKSLLDAISQMYSQISQYSHLIYIVYWILFLINLNATTFLNGFYIDYILVYEQSKVDIKQCQLHYFSSQT